MKVRKKKMQNKKQLTQQEKIALAEKYFDKIKKLFGDNHCNLMIHNLNMQDLDKKWTITETYNPNGKYYYKSAYRNKHTEAALNDITLFD